MKAWLADDNSFGDVLTIEDLMDYLSIGKNTAYRLVREKKIGSVKIGRAYKIPKTNVIEYLERESK